MSIQHWPAAERPRERLLQHGPGVLNDAELLAIFLRTGISGKNAVELGRDLLIRFGSLNQLFSASRDDFCACPGMGDAKFAQLQAVMEMARRALAETCRQQDALSSPSAVRDWLRLKLGAKHQEIFTVLFLDNQNRVTAHEDLFHGTLTEARVYPREVVKRALAHNAASVILAHNHPSGVAEPSVADRHLTKQLSDALGLVDIRILDHFVVTAHHITSFAETGWL